MSRKLIVALILAAGLAVFWLLTPQKSDTAVTQQMQPTTPAKQALLSKKHVEELRDCPDAIGALPMGRPCVPKHLKDLPADPGPASKTPPSGIDRNSNGVRDEIERYIAVHYVDPPQLRDFLMSIARHLQPMSSTELASVDQAVAISKDYSAALACKARFIGAADRPLKADELEETARWTRAAEDVSIRMLDTPERLKIYINNERLLAGQVVAQPTPKEVDLLCSRSAKR